MNSRLCIVWWLAVLVAEVLQLGSAKVLGPPKRGAECYPYYRLKRGKDLKGDNEYYLRTFHIPYTNVRPQEDFETHYHAANLDMLVRYYHGLVRGYPSISLVRDDSLVERNMTLRECLVEQWLSDEEKREVLYPMADISYNLHKGAYVFSTSDSLQSYVVRCPEIPLFYIRRAS